MRENEKIGLDDYLCSHSVENSKLPIHKIRKLTTKEMIADATPEIESDLKAIIKGIGRLGSEAEKSQLVNNIHAKTGISKRSIQKDVSVVHKENTNETEKIPLAEKLIKIAENYELFHDDAKESYAYIRNVAVKIRGGMFKQLLALELWAAENKSANSDALNQALNVIEAKAVFDGRCI